MKVAAKKRNQVEVMGYQEFMTHANNLHSAIQEHGSEQVLTSLKEEFVIFVTEMTDNPNKFAMQPAKKLIARSNDAANLFIANLHGIMKTVEFSFETAIKEDCETRVPLIYNSVIPVLQLLYNVFTMCVQANKGNKLYDAEVFSKFHGMTTAMCTELSLEMIEQLHVTCGLILKTSLPLLNMFVPQMAVVATALIKLAYGSLQVCQCELSARQLKSMVFSVSQPDLIKQTHHVHFTDYLNDRKLKGEPFAWSELIKIVARSSTHAYDMLDQGVLPECRYFCQFITHGNFIIRYFPDFVAKALEIVKTQEALANEALNKLIDEEVEQILAAQIQARSTRTPKGKQVGTKAAPVKMPITMISTRTESTQIIPVQIEREPVDEREHAFATLIVGEFVIARFLKPVLHLLGFIANDWSWNEVINAIEAEINGRLASRKAFLYKCIEWVRKRNQVAHPIVYPTCQLYKDLNQVKGLIGQSFVLELALMLETLRVSKSGPFQKGLNGFSRPDLGITPSKIQQTISTIRFTEFILNQTVGPFYRAKGTDMTLNNLKDWSSIFATTKNFKFTDNFMNALIALVEKRNALAHPKVSGKMVRVLADIALSGDPDFEVFLAHLGKNDD